MSASDRSPIFIALADLLLCVLAVVIVAVNPKAAEGGVKVDAEYEITAEWSVDIDAAVDLHVIVPDGKDGTDVFYQRRAFNNVSLDYDNKGFADSRTVQFDGTVVKARSAVETATIRGKIPGRFDVGVHMYSLRLDERPLGAGDTLDTPVTETIKKLNPHNSTVFTQVVTLHHVSQTINVASFELDRSGEITFVDPPLEPVTDHAFGGGTP